MPRLGGLVVAAATQDLALQAISIMGGPPASG
jgi:hypothetical protein